MHIFFYQFDKNQSFRSLMACGSSGSLISLICCGMFMFFTADIALVRAFFGEKNIQLFSYKEHSFNFKYS